MTLIVPLIFILYLIMIFYLQISADDLGSPLVPVLTNIFMIQLESLLILFFTEKRCWWKYVCAHDGLIWKFDAWHIKNQFSVEIKRNSFLSILIMHHSDNTNRPTANHQSINSDIGVMQLLLKQIGNSKH